MANVNLAWDHVDFEAKSVTGWVQFKHAVSIDEHENLLSNRAVYVIRISQPYAFSYGKKYSPVAYIGKGKAQQRITSHLRSWIPELADKISGLRIRIYFCEPRAPKLGTMCEHVEADLINLFCKRYGDRPLRNRQTPKARGKHQYNPAELHVLHRGKGPGYHWALRPLRSSGFYKAE